MACRPKGMRMLDLERLLLSEAPDAYVLMDLQGRVVYWNRCAEQIFGFAASEVMHQHLGEFIVPDDMREEEERVFRSTIAQGKAECHSIRKRKDGALLHLSVSNKLVRDAQGQPQYVLSCKRDISEAIVQRDISLIAASVHGLFDSVPDGIVVVNSLGRIVLANRRAGLLFDWDITHLQGQAIDVLLAPRFQQSYPQHMARCLNQPQLRAATGAMELYALRRDAQEFPVEISLSPLQVEGEHFVVSAIRDVSDRKRIERDLAEKNRALLEAVESRNRFLANTSHELRTPLNAILGFSELMLSELSGPLTPEQQEQLQTVHDSGQHLLGLITSLLDISRMDDNAAEMVPERLLCSDLLTQTVEALRSAALDKQLPLELDLCADEQPLYLNRPALSRILHNLTANAIKFTEQGQVRLQLRQQRDGSILTTRISVQDSGCGIGQADQARLFRAFTQLDASASRKHEGMGQGLYVSQKLARLLGGSIAVESQPGQGSTFTLSLQQTL